MYVPVKSQGKIVPFVGIERFPVLSRTLQEKEHDLALWDVCSKCFVADRCQVSNTVASFFGKIYFIF